MTGLQGALIMPIVGYLKLLMFFIAGGSIHGIVSFIKDKASDGSW